MTKRLYALLFASVAALTACGGGYGGGGTNPPGNGGGGGAPAGVGPQTIGFAIPSGTIGTVSTAPFGTIGGYTQSIYSQVIAFPPGTVITLKNLSTTTPHTLNVLSTSSFPATNPSTTAAGGNTLAAGFASGTLAAGATMQITLATAGTYYIGCAYHYNDAQSMRGVILVSANATPGPQATPQASGGGGGGGNPCPGGYC